MTAQADAELAADQIRGLDRWATPRKDSDFALNAHRQTAHGCPVIALKPGVAQQIGAQHGQGIVAPKHLAVDHKTGHTKQVQRDRFVRVVLQALLDFGAAHIGHSFSVISRRT